MERSWGKEVVKFARRELPALLNEYDGKPEKVLDELSKRWKAYCKSLQKRIDGLPKDDAPTSPPPAPSDSEDGGDDGGDK